MAIDGLPVLSLLPGSKAGRAGIHVGDVIVGLNGRRMTATMPLEEYGEALKLVNPPIFDVFRNGEFLTITLES